MVAVFAVDDTLLEAARPVLERRKRSWFVLGGAGAGKSTVCAAIGERHGVDVLDLDARLYGSWHGTFDACRHPVNAAWAGAPDPLAFLLRLSPDELLAFHAASAAEALDRLADELRTTDPARPLLVDGGLASIAVLSRVVPSGRIAHLALPVEQRRDAWTADADRRAFLDVVAGVGGVADATARFLAQDEAISRALGAEARAAGVRTFLRAPGSTVAMLAGAVADHLGIG